MGKKVIITSDDNMISTEGMIDSEKKKVEAQMMSDDEFELDEFERRVWSIIWNAEHELKKFYEEWQYKVEELVEQDPYYQGLDQDMKNEVDEAVWRATENTGKLHEMHGSGSSNMVMSKTWRERFKRNIKSLELNGPGYWNKMGNPDFRYKDPDKE